MTLMVHDYQPETDEQKEKRKAEAREKLVFKSVSFPEAKTRIAELLFKTMYYAKIKFDKDNPKSLGGVSFWFDTNAEGATMLMFDKHPSRWNRDAVISELEAEEYNFLYSGRFRQ